MPRYALATAIIMAVAGLAMLLLGAHSGNATSSRAVPSFSISQNFNAGDISTQVPYTFEHEFKFINDSGRPIDLSEVKPACGCTKWEADNRHFEPGETGSVKIDLTLRGSSPVTSSATLTWSTGQKSDVMLAARALVPREIHLSSGLLETTIDTPASFSLFYVDQNGVEPHQPAWSINGPATVTIGAWQSLTPDREKGKIAMRYMATGSVTITGPVNDVVRITLSLPDSGLPDCELVVRTPELVEQHRHGRPLPPPIVQSAQQGADSEK